VYLDELNPTIPNIWAYVPSPDLALLLDTVSRRELGAMEDETLYYRDLHGVWIEAITNRPI